MNRKAQTTAEDAMGIVALFFVLMLAAIIFVSLIGVDAGTKHVIREGVEETLFTQRVLSSPSCFTYRDNVNRAYPGIIDFTRFNQENFDQCFDNTYNNYAIRLTLVAKFLERQTIVLKTSNWQDYAIIEEKPPINVLVKDDEGEHLFEGELRIEFHKVG